MITETVNPHYEVIAEKEFYGIKGTKAERGETVFIRKISKDKETVLELAELLNRNGVSVLHAKDVIRDKITDFLSE